MNFTCSKDILSEAIHTILPAVGIKSSIISLDGFLFECNSKKSTLTIYGYNFDLAIKKEIVVENCKDGSIILPANLLNNIINKMPNGDITVSIDEKFNTLIKCEGVEFTILGLESTEYPKLPEIETVNSIKVPMFLLKKMLQLTLYCVSQGENNPVLTGAMFDIIDGYLTVVCLDGHRLSKVTEKINYTGENFEFIVPAKSLNEIVKIISKIPEEEQDDEIEIILNDKHVCMNINNYYILSTLLVGKFIDYKAAIPTSFESTVSVDRKALLNSITRTTIIVSERAKGSVRCNFEDSTLKINCETPIGKVSDAIEVEKDGINLVMGFNNRYLMEALKHIETDNVVLKMISDNKPIIIIPDDEEQNLTMLILPIRLV